MLLSSVFSVVSETATSAEWAMSEKGEWGNA